jgi:hypothetical protein
VLSLFRDPLAFPAGFAPGFDPTHIAAPGTLFSGIAASSGFIRLDRAVVGTKNGSPLSVIDGALGPSLQPSTTNNGTGNGYTFSSLSPTGSSNATLAAICRPLTFAGGSNGYIIGDSSGFQSIICYTNGGVRVYIGATLVNSGLAATASAPYFIAVSIISGSTFFTVMKNLVSGAIQSAAVTTSDTIGGGETSIAIGQMSGDNFGGNIAAAMYSNDALGLSELLSWAQ